MVYQLKGTTLLLDANRRVYKGWKITQDDKDLCIPRKLSGGDSEATSLTIINYQWLTHKSIF